MSFNHFLKQGGEADVHSLRITRFASTIPNMRAFCNGDTLSGSIIKHTLSRQLIYYMNQMCKY